MVLAQLRLCGLDALFSHMPAMAFQFDNIGDWLIDRGEEFQMALPEIITQILVSIANAFVSAFVEAIFGAY